MSTDDVLQPPSGPTLDEYGVPVEPRPDNRLVAYVQLAGLTILPIATAFAIIRYVPPHQSNQVPLGTWLMHSSPSGYLIVGSGWPRLVAFAGALIFIVPFLRRKQRRTALTALRGKQRRTPLTAIRTGTQVLLAMLAPMLFMADFAAVITLLLAAILPHGMPVTHCNNCGGG